MQQRGIQIEPSVEASVVCVSGDDGIVAFECVSTEAAERLKALIQEVVVGLSASELLF